MERWSRDLHKTHMALILETFRGVREEGATRTTREGLDMCRGAKVRTVIRTTSVGLDKCRGARVLAVTKII